MKALNLILNHEEQEYYQSKAQIMEEFRVSAKTAICRKGPSAPLKQIVAQYGHLIKGSVLNFGKGKESYDSDELGKIANNVLEYDFTHCPNIELLNGSYQTLYCGYVCNVLTPPARHIVWNTMKHLCCKRSGIVFVAVRSSSDRGIIGTPEFDGVRTSKSKTFQKGYKKQELEIEASRYFRYVKEISTKGSYRIVICSHSKSGL